MAVDVSLYLRWRQVASYAQICHCNTKVAGRSFQEISEDVW